MVALNNINKEHNNNIDILYNINLIAYEPIAILGSIQRQILKIDCDQKSCIPRLIFLNLRGYRGAIGRRSARHRTQHATRVGFLGV